MYTLIILQFSPRINFTRNRDQCEFLRQWVKLGHIRSLAVFNFRADLNGLVRVLDSSMLALPLCGLHLLPLSGLLGKKALLVWLLFLKHEIPKVMPIWSLSPALTQHRRQEEVSGLGAKLGPIRTLKGRYFENEYRQIVKTYVLWIFLVIPIYSLQGSHQKAPLKFKLRLCTGPSIGLSSCSTPLLGLTRVLHKLLG